MILFTMAAKLSNETYVHYHGTISEQVKKETQTKTNYDQSWTQYVFRLLQPMYDSNLGLNMESHKNALKLLRRGMFGLPWSHRV